MKNIKGYMAITLLATGISTAQATTVVVDAGWEVFSFGGVGSPISSTPFTFTLATAGVLTVTDAYLQGDIFDIHNFGSSLGLTSTPITSNASCGGDFDLCSADSGWSTGIYSLAAGSYSITGITTVSPFGLGAGALKVDSISSVPVPAAVWLFGSGLIGLVGVARRK